MSSSWPDRAPHREDDRWPSTRAPGTPKYPPSRTSPRSSARCWSTGANTTPSANLGPAAPGRPRVRVLRRAAVRQRAAALRPPDHRLRQGPGAALPDHAGQPGGAQVRLGLPRPARRGRGRTAARHLRQGRHPRHGHREVQPGLPRVGAALHPRLAGVRHPAGPLGRLRPRLQDARSVLHGERHVGVPAAVGQGPGLPGLQGAAVLLAVRDPAVQPRAADGRRHLRRAAGPVGHGPVQAGDRGVAAGLDHHAVDAAVQPGLRGRRGHQLRGAGEGRRAVHPGPGPAGRLRAGAGGRRRGRHADRGRAGRTAIRAAAALPHRRREVRHPGRVPGDPVRRRDDRGRHRRGAHGARLRRGRRPGLQRGRHPDRAHRGRPGPVHLRGARLRGPARLRRERRDRR